jgi:hypothetical protein
MKVTDALRAADALADFANLDPANVDPTDSKSVIYFKNNYPDFAPAEWWDYPYRIDGARVLRYEDVIKVPKEDPNFESKINKIIVQQWQYTREEIQKAWKTQFTFDSVPEVANLLKLVFYFERPGIVWNSQLLLPDGTIHEINTKLYSFHKAVLYLHGDNRWRAKICEKCGKVFAARAPKRKYCLFPDSRGETCSGKAINQSKLDYYYTKGKQKRQTKRKKSSPRLPGSRRKKAVIQREYRIEKRRKSHAKRKNLRQR